ncbi:MAG TPA: hypothetical protein VFF52_03565 [Isosphaeraceae bacterium]|nr:hypothetical protein [Isosphaeraceae bacterium]
MAEGGIPDATSIRASLEIRPSPKLAPDRAVRNPVVGTGAHRRKPRPENGIDPQIIAIEEASGPDAA